ncbi:hypothetical protein DLAC_07729 [Tieghemostelium lacteum]|uniref:Carbohydrate binding domain-containing protein n=1 Tax=Tieghemostelium lacteum TaxID=361077 RepID=A0A151ZA87_TIELA|nr:hypothetical protein DLAC_07729 [Tieghemostelium lacteum]|eukprot:KYQ90859.1 hypothetical protein DLAC_07729 [Tieghemostelium lacteum]
MKLELLLLFVIVGSVLVKCESSDDDIFGSDTKQCFKSGYSTTLVAISYNAFYPSGNGNSSTISFAEKANTTVEFSSQRMRIDYKIAINGEKVMGSLWAYGQNNTMYVLQNGSCTQLPLSFPVPSEYPPYKEVGKTKFGKVKVEILSMPSEDGNSEGVVLYDKKRCAPLGIMTKNIDDSNPGYSIINFFNFKNKVDENDFTLPGECNQSFENLVNLSKNKIHNPKTTTPTIPHFVHVL